MYFMSMWPPAGAVGAVARANPGLIDVLIQFYAVNEDEVPDSFEELPTDVIVSFGNFCPPLASLKIVSPHWKNRTWSEVIAHACIPFRHSGVSVSVTGVQYLTQCMLR